MKIKELLNDEQLERIRVGIINGMDIISLAKLEGITETKKIRFIRSYLIKKYSLSIKRVDNKNPWNKDELDELRGYLDNGMSYSEISTKFKNRHSLQSITGAVRNKNYDLTYSGNKRRIITKKEEEKIVEKIKSGKYSSSMLVNKFNVSSKQISNIIKKYDLTIPTNIEAGIVRNNFGETITKINEDTIRNAVLNSNKSLKDIAKELNISIDTLRRRMKLYKIVKPNKTAKRVVSPSSMDKKIINLTNILYNRNPTVKELRSRSFKDILTKDILEPLYIQHNRNTKEVSKCLNVSKSVIDKLINLYGIERNKTNTFFNHSLEYYKELLFVKKLTFSEIAKLVNLEEDTVRKHITNLIPESKKLNGFSSRGEIQTDKALRELNLTYDYNKCYFLDQNNHMKKFFIDFVVTIEDRVIWIEYNGKQHYQYIPYFYTENKEGWINQLKRDKIVREYSSNNNISLLEIPYTYETSTEIKKLISSVILNNKQYKPIDITTLFSEEAKQIYKTIT